jgi:DNA-binding beta-propeller fold protein YncE
MNTRSTILLLSLLASLGGGVLPLAEAPRCLAEPGRIAQPAAPRFLRQWGGIGSEPGQFHFPIGIAINAADEVFVTDFYNERVQKFDTDGKLLTVLEVPPGCGGIAVGRSGYLYVSHFPRGKATDARKADRITVYDRSGTFLKEWGGSGTGEGEFNFPGGLAAGRDGRLYVADQTNRRVQVFDAQGKFLTKWGEYGVKPAQFGGNVIPKRRDGGPQFVALDSEGHVYTTEASVGRVQKFTADGKFLLAWGDNEDKPGSFGGVFSGQKGRIETGPVGICVDRQDRVWVGAVSGRIQQFTKDGKYLRGFGEQGTKPGQFYAPHGIALDSHGNLYVVDAYNHRVQKFAVE